MAAVVTHHPNQDAMEESNIRLPHGGILPLDESRRMNHRRL